jgi:replicative DNA helicase
MTTASPRFGQGQQEQQGPRRGELARLFDRLPPHSIEAECALLGSMILDWRVIGEVVQVIKGGDDFYKPHHAALYQILVECYDQNIPVDAVQLNERLRDRGILEQIGGVAYIIELGEAVPSAASAQHYAKIVREKAILRSLIDSAGKILHQAYTSVDPAPSQLDSAEQEIFRIAQTLEGSSDMATLGSLVEKLYSDLALHANDGRRITGVETGFYELDEMTSGLQNGEMIIVAGRPSMGKTAYALNLAEHAAVVRKQPVAIFSLEMSKQQLAQRFLCSRSGVDSHKLRRNMLGDEDFHQLVQACTELTDAPLYIDDTPGLTLLALRAKARRLASRHHIKMIVVDYLQLMSCPGSESRQQEVSEISRGIKALARELSVPVICLSQLNRSPEGREDHRPRMSDLRESGSIEQDADVVMMLHREEYYHNDPAWAQENPDLVGVAESIICKQRNGPTGTVYMSFNGSTTRFSNLARSVGPVPGG